MSRTAVNGKSADMDIRDISSEPLCLLDEQDVARGCSRELLKANVIFDIVDKS
jgi:hypothetical protein